MEEYNFIGDIFSGEILLLVVAERIWGKIRGWIEERAMDKRLDKMSETISYLKGKLNKE